MIQRPTSPPPASPSGPPSSAQFSIQDTLELISQDLEELSLLTGQLTASSVELSDEIQVIATQNTSLQNMLQSIANHTGSQESEIIIAKAKQDGSEMSVPSQLTNASIITPKASSLASPQDNTDDDESSDVTPRPERSTRSFNDDHSSRPEEEGVIMINNLEPIFLKELNNTLVDNLGSKAQDDFRIILQNPNGIRVYHDNDPEYLPSIETLKEAEVDMFCLTETNVPWHKTDLLYNISKQNQITWNHIPVKTVAASCRKDTYVQANYQPGGCLTTITNTMTTKIKNATSDYMGRWTKINFFATGGTVAIYTIYRPNPSSLRQAGGETVWMQQQRILEKEKDKENPRKQLILDLIGDIKANNKNNTTEVILLGDFNEDPRDNEDDGLHMLMGTCNLINVFEERFQTLPSTRNNERAIDHILVTPGILRSVRTAGLIPKDIGFSNSDHQGIFIDLKPSVLDTKISRFNLAP